MKITEMKKEALSALSGKYKTYVLTSFIVFFFSILVSLVITFVKNQFVAQVLNLLSSLIFILFSYALVGLALKVSRNEDISVKNFFDLAFGNVKGVYRVTFKTILYLILPLICIIASSTFLLFSIFSAILSESFSAMILIALVAFVASFVYLLVASLSYSLTNFLLYDNPTSTGKEINQTSKKLMKGFKGKYFLTYLSFFGWMLLISIAANLISLAFSGTVAPIVAVILSNLGMAVLIPYVNTTLAFFYQELAEEKTVVETTNV